MKTRRNSQQDRYGAQVGPIRLLTRCENRKQNKHQTEVNTSFKIKQEKYTKHRLLWNLRHCDLTSFSVFEVCSVLSRVIILCSTCLPVYLNSAPVITWCVSPVYLSPAPCHLLTLICSVHLNVICVLDVFLTAGLNRLCVGFFLCFCLESLSAFGSFCPDLWPPKSNQFTLQSVFHLTVCRWTLFLSVCLSLTRRYNKCFYYLDSWTFSQHVRKLKTYTSCGRE